MDDYDFDYEPDLDEYTEFTTAMDSIGWGDDDAYGTMIGGDSDLMGEY